ncbi:hypothetical protein [Shimia sp. Alg240-R146]|uniref:hypothetical protein n=1 Tax=Shimia sp. Alg240-R146 TaxID=2993449 RepID=UPI0022E64409|nr:hypothetical protein [Shimia sp. Alg240-R146]
MEFLVAIFAALAAALLTYLAQNYFAMQSEDSAHLNDHISEIKIIESYAVEYWLADPDEEEKKQRLYQVKLEGAISSSSCFNEDAQRILGYKYTEYVKLDQAIFEAATGGAFGTAEKAIDYNRVVEIMTLCTQMRSLLRQSRRIQYMAN